MKDFTYALLNLIRIKEIEQIYLQFYPDEEMVDDISMLDRIQEDVRVAIRACVSRLDSRAIQSGLEILGLILLYYATIRNQPDRKMIFSSLSDMAFDDKLTSFIVWLQEDDLSRQESIKSRLNQFLKPSVKIENTIKNWVVKGINMMYSEFPAFNNGEYSFPANSTASEQVVEFLKYSREIDILVSTILNAVQLKMDYPVVFNEKKGRLRELISVNTKIIVTGASGTGKTTMIKDLFNQFPKLMMDNIIGPVFIDLSVFKNLFLQGENLYEAVCSIYFSEYKQKRREIVSHLKWLDESGNILFIFDNFSCVHKITDDDLLDLRKSALLFDEQKQILEAISVSTRIVIVVANWQIDLVKDLLLPRAESSSEDIARSFVKVCNLNGRDKCLKKMFSSRLRIPCSSNNDLADFYLDRYGPIFSDFHGVNAAKGILSGDFDKDEHIKISHAYVERVRGVQYTGQDIGVSESKEVVLPDIIKICHDVAEIVVRNLNNNDSPINYPLSISANFNYPQRDILKSEELICALNSHLFDLHWINNALYLKFSNRGICAIYISIIQPLDLQGDMRSGVDENEQARNWEVASSVRKYSELYSSDALKTFIAIRGMNKPIIIDPFDPCESEW